MKFYFSREHIFNQFIINRVWSISTYTDFLQYSNRNITRQPLGEVCDVCYVYKSLSFDSMSKYVDICKTSLKHIPYIIGGFYQRLCKWPHFTNVVSITIEIWGKLQFCLPNPSEGTFWHVTRQLHLFGMHKYPLQSSGEVLNYSKTNFKRIGFLDDKSFAK